MSWNKGLTAQTPRLGGIKRFLLAPIMLMLALVLAGCPKSESFGLYNNYGSDVVVHFKDGDATWRQGSRLTLEGSLLDKLVVVTQVMGSQSVQRLAVELSLNGARKRYILSGWYWTDAGSETRTFLQLESDGFLYTLREDPGSPVPSRPLPQPNGFPIRPE